MLKGISEFLKGLETKKVIALGVCLTLCILSILQFVYNREISDGFMAIGSSVIAFYFGAGIQGKNVVSDVVVSEVKKDVNDTEG